MRQQLKRQTLQVQQALGALSAQILQRAAYSAQTQPRLIACPNQNNIERGPSRLQATPVLEAKASRRTDGFQLQRRVGGRKRGRWAISAQSRPCRLCIRGAERVREVQQCGSVHLPWRALRAALARPSTALKLKQCMLPPPTPLPHGEFQTVRPPRLTSSTGRLTNVAAARALAASAACALAAAVARAAARQPSTGTPPLPPRRLVPPMPAAQSARPGAPAPVQEKGRAYERALMQSRALPSHFPRQSSGATHRASHLQGDSFWRLLLAQGGFQGDSLSLPGPLRL